MEQRPLKGWWTLIFAGLLALAGAAQAFDWTTVLPQQYVGLATMIIAALVAALRTLTTTPVGKS